MANEDAKFRDSLQRHLMQYNGQALTYEMVRRMMSFVFDRVTNDPCIAWISKDSHIRLLNGIFKRVGQPMDDKYIQSLIDSIFSSLVITQNPDTSGSALKLARPLRPSGRQTEMEPAAIPSQAGLAPTQSAAMPRPATGTAPRIDEKNTADSAYQRVLLDLAIFENRISRTIEASAAESREADKRLMEERIELEARLSRDRAELEASFARERALQDARHAKEHTEIADWINRLYVMSSEQTQKTEALLSTRLADINHAIAGLTQSSTNSLSEQGKKYEDSAKEAGLKFNTQLEGMARTLEVLESKLALAAKSRRRMAVLWVISLTIIVAGFYAVLFVK